MEDNIWFSLIILAVVIFFCILECREINREKKARFEQRQSEREAEQAAQAEFELKVAELQKITEGKEAGG